MIITSTMICELVKKNKKKSESIFPKLIEKLIKASVNKNGYIRFPSGDAVFTPGADGILTDIKSTNSFVPDGNSFWEIGTNGGAIEKIKTDYEKRETEGKGLNKADYSYIAVTSGIIDSTKKQAFCDEKSKSGPFKKVYIIDANDLETWLGQHIDVSIWLLQEYNKSIDDYDIVLLRNEWEQIANSTSPALTTGLFALGNESKAIKFVKDIQEQKSNKIYTISSPHYGKDHAYYFCMAAILSSGDDNIIDKTVIVNSQSALDYVSAYCENKIVIINFNCTNERFAYVLYNTYILFEANISSDVQLDLIQQREFIKKLEEMGLNSSQAHKTAFLVDYNLPALKRMLAKTPMAKRPQWVKDKNKNELIPLMLIGEINMSEKGDVDILKALVGEDYDDYIEKLNYWSEQPEPPIIKYNSVYKMSSRKECFDYIRMDIFSLKVQKLEKKLISILSVADEKYAKESRYWDINDGSYPWREKVINNILEGFIILAEKNKSNQIHFDLFIRQILEKLFGNIQLSLTLSHLFSRIVDLSPDEFLSFLLKEIKEDKDTLISVLRAETGGFLGIRYVNYILWSLDHLFQNKSTAAAALNILLTLYDECPNIKEIKDEVVNIVSPLGTTAGRICIPLNKKINIFFEFISSKDKGKYVDIVKQLQTGGAHTIMVSERPSYKIENDENVGVAWQEVFDMESRCLTWLLEVSDQNQQVENIKNILAGMHNKPVDLMCQDLDAFKTVLIDINDDNIKAKIRHEILGTREEIIKYKWEECKVYIQYLDEIAIIAEPKDEYVKRKDILFNAEFPLWDPPYYEDEGSFQKETAQREQLRKECVGLLISKYGQGIIERIINDSPKQVYAIWASIYLYSNNHNRDLSLLINNNLKYGIEYYLSQMDITEISLLLENNDYKKTLLPHLPYNEKLFKVIDGDIEESLYWENQNPLKDRDVGFEYVFNKFIQFAPYKLIPLFAYFAPLDYDHGIILLKAISQIARDEAKKEQLNEEEDELRELVKKFDQKFYTEELSKCEFELLPFLQSYLSDYPLGIKKYFWDHPEFLGQFLVALHTQKGQLKDNSLGKRLLFEAFCSFGSGCYIPADYLIQKKDELRNWVERVLNQSNGDDEHERRLVKSAIINTLACCPSSIMDDVWPNVEIANILEFLAESDYDEPSRVSSNFYCAYVNRRGVRTVTDGSAEIALSAEFLRYKEKYQFSHPVTSQALDYIANSYQNEGERDRTRAYLGEE